MDARILRHCFFLLLCLLLISDSCFATIFPFEEAINNSNNLDDQENQVTFTSPGFGAQLDDVPIVEPTTPGMGPPATTPPDVNPYTPGMGPPATTPPDVNPYTPGMGPPATTPPDVNPYTPGMGPPATTPGMGPPTTTPPTTPQPGTIPPPTTTQPGGNPPPTTAAPGGQSGGGSWCIAKPSASQTSLQVALDYACGYGGADCSAIQAGASCYEPDTIQDHASYAFNSYYQKNPSPTSCDFGGAAQLTTTDPSRGNCKYAAASSTPTTPANPPPTPPSTMTPVNPYPPGGYGSEPTDYGLEPTGNPSAANSFSHYLSLVSTVACFAQLLFACRYL